MDIVKQDLIDMEITWEEAKVLIINKEGWHQCVAQCWMLDDLRSKVRSYQARIPKGNFWGLLGRILQTG